MFHAIYPKKTWEKKTLQIWGFKQSCVPELFLRIIVFYTHSHVIGAIVLTSQCIELLKFSGCEDMSVR